MSNAVLRALVSYWKQALESSFVFFLPFLLARLTSAQFCHFCSRMCLLTSDWRWQDWRYWQIIIQSNVLFVITLVLVLRVLSSKTSTPRSNASDCLLLLHNSSITSFRTTHHHPVHIYRTNKTIMLSKIFFSLLISSIHAFTPNSLATITSSLQKTLPALPVAASTLLIPSVAKAFDTLDDVEIADLPPIWVPIVFALGILVGVGLLTSSLGDVYTEEASLGLMSGAKAKKEAERSRSSYFKRSD